MSVYISFLRGLLLLVVIALIVAAGWDEPLRYRFMNPGEISQAEAPLRTPAPVAATPRFQPYSSPLDGHPR